MCRAVRAIQKIIQVIRPTATIESVPPMASCASNDSPDGPNVRMAPNPSDAPTATPTPAHSAGSWSRRSDLTRYATRMLTTSAASRPSRRPMR